MSKATDIEDLCQELCDAFKEKVNQIPDFEYISVQQINPIRCVSNGVECSQSLDAVSKCIQEIPIIRNQLMLLEKEVTTGYGSPSCVVNTKEWFLNMEKMLAERRKTLVAHSSTLKGLISAMSRSNSISGSRVLD